MAAEPALEPAAGLRVSWDADAIAAYRDGDDELRPAWRLEGSLGPGHTVLRVLSAAIGDGSLVLLAAVRPEGAAGHDAEAVAAVLVDPDGAAQPIEEALMSTEYAGDGSIRRLGLELYRPGDDFPLRGAGDAAGSSSSEAGGSRRDAARLRFRLDGREGVALYEIVRPL